MSGVTAPANAAMIPPIHDTHTYFEQAKGQNMVQGEAAIVAQPLNIQTYRCLAGLPLANVERLCDNTELYQHR
jgi:hypothetical protein